MTGVTAKTSVLFAGKVNQDLLAQAVRVFLSNRRQATAKVKTRSEVNRTKKKWFKQKGTGNARHGAQTPAIFVGGGVAHGPTGEQHYRLQLPTKMKQMALRMAFLSRSEQIVIEDRVMEVDGKTKSGIAALGKLASEQQRILVVVAQMTPELRRSFSNLAMVWVVTATSVNLLQVMQAETIVMTKAALTVLEERILGEKSTKEVKVAPDKAPAVAKPKASEAVVEEKKPVARRVATKSGATKKVAEKKDK